jgi:hypothetical protein
VRYRQEFLRTIEGLPQCSSYDFHLGGKPFGGEKSFGGEKHPENFRLRRSTLHDSGGLPPPTPPARPNGRGSSVWRNHCLYLTMPYLCAQTVSLWPSLAACKTVTVAVPVSKAYHWGNQFPDAAPQARFFYCLYCNDFYI